MLFILLYFVFATITATFKTLIPRGFCVGELDASKRLIYSNMLRRHLDLFVIPLSFCNCTFAMETVEADTKFRVIRVYYATSCQMLLMLEETYTSGGMLMSREVFHPLEPLRVIYCFHFNGLLRERIFLQNNAKCNGHATTVFPQGCEPAIEQRDMFGFVSYRMWNVSDITPGTAHAVKYNRVGTIYHEVLTENNTYIRGFHPLSCTTQLPAGFRRCAVCFDENDKPFVKLNHCCNNTVHESCIVEYGKKSILCPVCRHSYEPYITL